MAAAKDAQKCQTEVRTIVKDVASASMDVLAASKDCTHDRQRCVVDMSAILDFVDDATHQAEQAVGDCGDGEETDCTRGLVKVVDDLKETSHDLAAAISDCSVNGPHWLQDCFDDVQTAAKALWSVISDTMAAHGECKKQNSSTLALPKKDFKSCVDVSAFLTPFRCI